MAAVAPGKVVAAAALGRAAVGALVRHLGRCERLRGNRNRAAARAMARPRRGRRRRRPSPTTRAPCRTRARRFLVQSPCDMQLSHNAQGFSRIRVSPHLLAAACIRHCCADGPPFAKSTESSNNSQPTWRSAALTQGCFSIIPLSSIAGTRGRSCMALLARAQAGRDAHAVGGAKGCESRAGRGSAQAHGTAGGPEPALCQPGVYLPRGMNHILVPRCPAFQHSQLQACPHLKPAHSNLPSLAH